LFARRPSERLNTADRVPPAAMTLGKTPFTWLERLRAWLGRPRAAPPSPTVPYPDYVECPHCGEPEVEVWCNEATARCHNCGRTFDHPLPAECDAGYSRS